MNVIVIKKIVGKFDTLKHIYDSEKKILKKRQYLLFINKYLYICFIQKTILCQKEQIF